MEQPTRKLVLENGKVFSGHPFGAGADTVCEIVFNTNMVGYQEIVSDPANAGQIVLMTYPLIGNYGMTDEDFESRRPGIGGLVVREYNPIPSNFRYTRTLGEVLEEQGIPGICGMDTRMLVRLLRDAGPQRALITDFSTPHEECMERLKQGAGTSGLVAGVSCKRPYYSRTASHRFNVVAIDCGIKQSAIRQFNQRRCNVTVMPYDATAQEVLAQHPDGLFLSSGPGDPAEAPQAAQLVRALKGRLPIFGVGLGHQIICLAYGAKAFKRALGHRGGYPVKNVLSGKTMAVSQNHGYDVEADSLTDTGLTVSHINVMDGSVEGVECEKDGVFAVQFYPEGAPGSRDGLALYDRFIESMKEGSAHA